MSGGRGVKLSIYVEKIILLIVFRDGEIDAGSLRF